MNDFNVNDLNIDIDSDLEEIEIEIEKEKEEEEILSIKNLNYAEEKIEINKNINLGKSIPIDLSSRKDLDLYYANLAVKSGILPEWIDTPEKFIIAITYAKELNLPILTALKSMYIINGVPSINVSMMTTLIRKAGHSFRIIHEFATVENTNSKGVKTIDKFCEIHAYRKDDNLKDANGNPIPHVVKFYWSEAARMGLVEKKNWVSMPNAMLKARCISKMARDVFSDVCNGYYLTEELYPDMPIQNE